MADKGLGLERRCLRGKSKVKIPVSMQDNAGVVFTVAEEEFALLYEAYRPSNLPFHHSAYERFSLANKDLTEC